jgi:tRNA dimethylallyltransferase
MHICGNLELNEAIAQAKRRTRNFARRQLTWFKKIPDVKWFNADEVLNAPLRSFLPDRSLLES